MNNFLLIKKYPILTITFCMILLLSITLIGCNTTTAGKVSEKSDEKTVSSDTGKKEAKIIKEDTGFPENVPIHPQSIIEESKKEIPTREVKLSTGEVVVIYNYMTTGDSRKLQRLMLEKGKFDPQTGDIVNLPVSVFLEMQDAAAKILIKEIKDGEGGAMSFSQEWLDNLPIKDGNKVYDTLNEITQEATMLPEEKKE